MTRVSVRDREAQRTAQPLTGKTVELVPDPAILLSSRDPGEACRLLRDAGVPLGDKPLVGVTTRRWFPSQRRLVPNVIRSKFRPVSDADSRPLAGLIATALDRVIESRNAFVVFLPTYTRRHEGDDRICRMIREAMSSDRARMIVVNDAAMYKALTAQMAVLVGGRMHPTILAVGSGTPVVGLAYNQKFDGFFDLIGQRNRLLSMTAFVRERQVDRLAALIIGAIEEGGAGLEERVDELGRSVRRFNRELLERIV